LYLDAVSRELDSICGEAAGPLRTIYVGGGTPTLLPTDFYGGFFRILEERFDLSRLEEATVESDGEFTAGDGASLVRAGFDRISVGVKSFKADIRDILGVGRLKLSDPVAAARIAGFSSVSLDIVYGVQGQILGDFVSDLDHALSLAPDHVSLYALEERGDAGPGQGDPDISAAMFRESMRILRQNGLRQYEITNFARPGHRSVHNSAYWRDRDYFGLGPSAHSSLTRNGVRMRWRNRPEIAAYLEDPEGCREEVIREGGADRAREALILGLRMSEGVERTSFTTTYGFDPVELIRPHFRDLVEFGLLRSGARRVRLTTRGMLLSNEVFVRIL
jgi:oxygen-independent coproporphyrinogen-3 oxidase